MHDPSRRSILIALITPATAITIGTGSIAVTSNAPREKGGRRLSTDWRGIPNQEQIKRRSIRV